MENIASIKVKNKIIKDVKKIEELIELQLSQKKYRECPLYQDVIDTQIFGISKELELALEVGLISEDYSKEILEGIEQKMSLIYAKIEQKKVN